MNDDLKELLDLRKDSKWQVEYKDYEYRYSGYEIKLLLDYITRLEDVKELIDNDKSKGN